MKTNWFHGTKEEMQALAERLEKLGYVADIRISVDAKGFVCSSIEMPIDFSDKLNLERDKLESTDKRILDRAETATKRRVVSNVKGEWISPIQAAISDPDKIDDKIYIAHAMNKLWNTVKGSFE
jgi:hypothetical protein